MSNIKPDTRVTAQEADADIDSYLALKAIPGYTPHNPAHSVEAATAAYNELLAAEEDVLLAENVVHEWQAKGAHLAELLDYARLRPLASASLQASLL